MQTWSPFVASSAARAPTEVALCRTFRALAVRTESWLTESRRLCLVPTETAITDLNLFELATRHPNNIRVQRFTAPVEAENGGDWEWVIGTWSVGWIRTRVQAKKLDDRGTTYPYLDHRPSATAPLQVETFLGRAGTLPAIYCFYNGRPVDPEPVPWAPSCDPTADIHGCSIAAAKQIRALVANHDKSLASIARLSVPWSDLVCCASDPAAALARIQDVLESLGTSRRQVDAQPPDWGVSLLERANAAEFASVEGLDGVMLIDLVDEHRRG